MSNWREQILSEFVPQVSRLTLVADPDSLLTEEKLANELRRRGFDLIEFTDPIEFRYAYESGYRSIWDSGESTDLVVILRFADNELEKLPFDLLRAGRRLSFSLGSIFPNLYSPVINCLDRSLLDRLFDSQQNTQPGRCGDNDTRDFVLRHVYGVAAELIANDVDLLRALLRIHYSGVALPVVLADRLTRVLSTNEAFTGWPLASIVQDSACFYAFLQERWPKFVLGLYAGQFVRDKLPMRFSGPENLPFDHQDIKVYIDNLFVEGKLQPVTYPGLEISDDSWVRCGVNHSAADDENIRLQRLFELVEKKMPGHDARHQEWLSFARLWAELLALKHLSQTFSENDRFEILRGRLDAEFTVWLQSNFAGLVNLPSTRPVMVHHVARHLASSVSGLPGNKVALVVVDGMSLDQWVTVRNSLKNQRKSLSVKEDAVFAWVPTLTSVSRQAIFAARPPIFFPGSIDTTNSEEAHWRQFWDSQGIVRQDVIYRRSLGENGSEAVLDELINPAKTRVIGLVIDKIDKIMHGMQLGAPGMHNQVKLWCDGGCLLNFIDRLLVNGFDVWLTSDHGNRESVGIGSPAEGAIAEIRGERVRVYQSEDLRSRVAEKFATAIKWEPVGLPGDYLPLVASESTAFVQNGARIVGHGGISLEEVIVPLIRIEREP